MCSKPVDRRLTLERPEGSKLSGGLASLFFFFFFGEFMPGVGYSLSCSEFPFCYEYFLAPFFSSPLVIGSTYWSFSRDLTTQSPLQLHVVTRLNVNQWDRRGNNICNPRSHFLFPSFCSWDNCLCKGIIRASPSAIKCSPQDIPWRETIFFLAKLLHSMSYQIICNDVFFI